jgi:NitT/TauT family transport system permease protein
MAWIAVVVSELVGVKSGLGYSLYQAYQFGRMDVMIATMVTLGVLGLVSDRAVGLLAKVMIRN